MANIKDQLYFIMEGSRVERFHTWPLLKPDTDGRHSHGVALMCYLITDGMPSAALLMAALTHDLAEQVPGDVSSPAKWALGIGGALGDLENEILEKNGLYFEANLSPEEKQILKWADAFDGMLTCCREAAMGNKLVKLPMGRWNKHIWEGPTLSVSAGRVFNAIRAMWAEAARAEGPDYDCFANLHGVIRAYEPKTEKEEV